MPDAPRPVVPEILPSPGARRWALGESRLGVDPATPPVLPPPAPAGGEFVVTPPPSEPAPADSPKE